MSLKFKKASVLLLSIIISITFCIPSCVYAASEDELRSSVVSVASGEVGYTGTSTNSKYGDWYGYQGGWCTTFVLWCFNQVGESSNTKLNGVIIPRGGNCNSMISWFKDKGRYYSPSDYTPNQGDLVFFDWNGSGSCDHVGIVNYTSGSTVYTIEGNCSGKVKAREYTAKGSKPYNNISAIIGYASPNYASVSGQSEQTTAQSTTAKHTTKKATTTKKPKTTKKTTTTKQTTTKKATTTATTKKAAATTAKPTAKESTTQTTTKATAQTTTEFKTESTTESATVSASQASETTVSLTNLSIYASNYDLQIGDSVKLEYSVEPSDVNAVVGYFCDQEGIIEIGAGGEIKAIGTGTATVVVCANDDLYAQCDFNVTDAVGEVSTMENNEERKVVATRIDVSTTQANAQSMLTRLGVNVNMLAKNKQLYIVPISIAGVTAFVSIFIALIKKSKKK